MTGSTGGPRPAAAANVTEDSPEPAKPGVPKGSKSFDALYDRSVESLLNVPVSDECVDSTGGRTHLLTAGDPSA
ncbi:hypothetical protein [Natronoarchaeum sp. GCM10025703]|uniref:hypothetical protein n=1 Tax=Natronoarchaeum sp. GCM10025703 TaxID=3252685 RepID=UPI0036709559